MNKQTTPNVTDPVCGMSFHPEKAAAQVTYNGTTYHFCTEACKEQFDADPERYARPAGGPRPAAGSASEESA